MLHRAFAVHVDDVEVPDGVDGARGDFIRVDVGVGVDDGHGLVLLCNVRFVRCDVGQRMRRIAVQEPCNFRL